MRMSVMSGFISDEQDEKFVKAFSESEKASAYLQRYLPNDTDSEFYHCDNGLWVEIRNRGGRLHVEIGEPSA